MGGAKCAYCTCRGSGEWVQGRTCSDAEAEESSQEGAEKRQHQDSSDDESSDDDDDDDDLQDESDQDEKSDVEGEQSGDESEKEETWNVKRILRQRGKGKSLQYEVEWEGDWDLTWEPAAFMANTIALKEYKAANAPGKE